MLSRRSGRRGFTLIELLVVIAIIAILAAILFPVFAQAREKARQSTCTSDAKQVALAVTQYAQDYDERFPLSYGLRVPGAPANVWQFAQLAPADWARSQLNQQRSLSSMNAWVNTLQPYLKNYQMFGCPSGPSSQFASLAADYTNPVSTPGPMTYTYNGMLHSYPQSGIATPSALPMAWEGQGKTQRMGTFLSSPILTCDPSNQAPCRYAPCGSVSPAYPGSAMFTTTGTMWVHNLGTVWMFADGHAKWRRIALGTGPANINRNICTDPFAEYDTNGFPISFWVDGCGNAWMFRPDYNFGPQAAPFQCTP